MKRIVFTCLNITLLLIASRLDAQQVIPFQPPQVTKPALAAKAKLQATIKFGYLKDRPDAESIRERREFNEAGYPTLIYKFSDNGGIEGREEYEYDASGTKILKALQMRLGKDSEILEERRYLFDEKGELLLYQRESITDGFFGMGNTYDGKGNVLVRQYFERDRLPGPSENFAYDAQGRCTSMTRLDIAGDVELKVTYDLDAKGRKIKETHFYKGSVLLFSIGYEYDSYGRLVKIEKMGRTNEVSAWESFKYDSKGHNIEHLHLDQGDPAPMTERKKYDAKGRMIEHKVLDHDGSLFQWYKYAYDSTGTGAGFVRLHADQSVSMEDMSKYDGEGRILSHRIHFADGSGTTEIEYRYDVFGLPMEEKHNATGVEQEVYWFVHERR